MIMRYPALTIWQPWASLIAAGAKPYEWRGWAAPRRLVGQRIAIHAGAHKVVVGEIQALLYLLDRHGEAGMSLIPDVARPLLERWATAPGMLPLSSVLCTARLGQPIPAKLYAEGKGVADSDRIDHTKWGWPLTDIVVLEPFQPARGAQGFWAWEGEAP
jgi:hypothetical protein